jgi:ComF family protein
MGVGRVHYICDACWQGIEFLSRPWCRICGVPFNFRGQPAPDRNDVCGNCEGQPSLYGKLRSIAFYEPTLREAIHLFKYDKKHILIKSLIQLIQEHLPTDLPAADYDFLLPIPLHTRRYRERGFNQSESIAQGIAQVWNVPVRTDILFRIRDTAPQSSMNSREERVDNIAGAFEVRSPASIRDRQILLVDDIFTTGTTINEALSVLQAENPAVVDVLTLART